MIDHDVCCRLGGREGAEGLAPRNLLIVMKSTGSHLNNYLWALGLTNVDECHHRAGAGWPADRIQFWSLVWTCSTDYFVSESPLDAMILRDVSGLISFHRCLRDLAQESRSSHLCEYMMCERSRQSSGCADYRFPSPPPPSNPFLISRGRQKAPNDGDD